MTAALLEERRDYGADAAEYAFDRTLCPMQTKPQTKTKTKCNHDTFEGTGTSKNMAVLHHSTRASPITAIESISRALYHDVSQSINALDALTSKLLEIEENHAFRLIAGKRAGGCAILPVDDALIPPAQNDLNVLDTPLAVSELCPTHEIDQNYEITRSLNAPPDDCLPTWVSEPTKAPAHGAVHVTEPSGLLACEEALGHPTRNLSTDIDPAHEASIPNVPQRDPQTLIPTPTKESPAHPLDAYGFPDICASTSIAGQVVGKDGAGGRSGDSTVLDAPAVVPLATDDDIWNECLPADQYTLGEGLKFGNEDEVGIDAIGFPDCGASHYVPNQNERSSAGSLALSDATTLAAPAETLHSDEEQGLVVESPALSTVSSGYYTPASPTTAPSEEGFPHTDQIQSAGPPKPASDERPNGVTAPGGLPGGALTSTADSSLSPPTLGHDVPPELFQQILSYIWDVVWRPGVKVTADDYRGLGQLALVSRYWAKHIRPLILEELRIHDVHGVQRMMAILKPPKSLGLEHPAAFMRRLRLVCRDSFRSWVHQVTRLVSQTPELARNVTVDLLFADNRRSTKGASRFPKSIFYYLPKTWPSLFGHIFRLTLKDVRFDAASDMFHLVSDIHNLRSLELNNVSWSPSSPHQSPDPWPAFLRDIVVFETERYGHGGRGILPWIIANAVDFAEPRKTRSGSSALLPPRLCPYPWGSTRVPFAHPSQYGYILEMLDVFSHPTVSSILESSQTIEWDVTRTKTGDYLRPNASQLWIAARQRFPSGCFPPVVAPSLVLSLERKPGSSTPQHMYVTHIALDVDRFQPTLEELLLYDWRVFINAAARFEFLETVEMTFETRLQCSRMFQEHEVFVDYAHELRRHHGLTKCTYKYSVEGVGVQWTR